MIITYSFTVAIAHTRIDSSIIQYSLSSLPLNLVFKIWTCALVTQAPGLRERVSYSPPRVNSLSAFRGDSSIIKVWRTELG
jgi:hypothetical protein